MWQLGGGSGLSAPAGLAFGADGLLYVVSSGSDRVLVFDGGGNLVRTIGAGSPLSAPRGVAVGPDGSLCVGNSNGTLERFAPDGTDLGTLGAGAGLVAPTDLAFGADGHLFVTSSTAGRVLELDGSGALVRELGAGAGLTQAVAVALGPDGRLAIGAGSGGDVVLLDALGATAGSFSGGGALDGAAGLSFGPDGLLYVMARDGAGLVAVDSSGAVQRTLTAGPNLVQGGALAFVPRRFPVTVKGTLRRADGPPLALSETGTLSIAPGTATALLQLTDGASANDLASVFGGTTLALRGFAAAEDGGKKWRLAASAGGPACAAVAAELAGAPSAQGLWLASGAKGDLWRASSGASFRGTLKTGVALQ